MTEQITNQQDGGALIFLTCDNVEVMRFAPNGDCYVKGNLVENDKEIIKELKQWLVYDQKDRIQSFARKVVEEIENLHPDKGYSDHWKIGYYQAKEDTLDRIRSLSGLSGECGRACGNHPTYGFVPEADCPIHDTPQDNQHKE